MSRRRFRLVVCALALAAAAGLVSCAGRIPTRLRVELLPVPGYPLASLRILITVGSANDPPGQEGLCRLAWSLLVEGGSRTADAGEVAARLFPFGEKIGLSVDKELSVFSGTVRAADLDAYYSVFRDCLLDPGFREEDFQRAKSRQLAFLERSLPGGADDPLADEVLNLMLYGGHPYGHPSQGVVASVKALTLGDVEAFYRKYFVQGNIIFGLGGDFRQELMSQALADFERLPQGSTPAPVLPPARRPEGIEVGIAEKATSTDSIRLGFPVEITKTDKDYFPLWIAAASLTEDVPPFDRLVREDGSLAPGSRIADAAIEHAAWVARPFPRPNHGRRQQHFSIRLAVPESGGGARAAGRILGAIRKLVDEGIPEERLERTRARLQSEVRLYARTLQDHLAWRMDSKLAGNLDFLDEVQYALPRVGRDDVNGAVRKYFSAVDICLAVVTGEAKAFASEIGASAVRTAPASEFFRVSGWPGR